MPAGVAILLGNQNTILGIKRDSSCTSRDTAEKHNKAQLSHPAPFGTDQPALVSHLSWIRYSEPLTVQGCGSEGCSLAKLLL